MRKFLVVLDDSRECLNAIRYATMRAENTGGMVQVIAVITPGNALPFLGIGRVMRNESIDRVKAHYDVFAKWMKTRHNVDSKLIIREGMPLAEILKHIQTDTSISILVLGAGTTDKGPGPLVSSISRDSGAIPVPLTIVPGSISKQRLIEITR